MRFEREAKTLASLNHPTIAAIYGIEDLSTSSGQVALVMEPAGREVLYSAAWDGADVSLFSTLVGSNEMQASSLPSGDVLSESKQGELYWC